MDLTDILARWMGIASIIIGVAMFFRKKLMLEIVHEFFKHREAAFWVGSVELLLGLFLVIVHWEWNNVLEIIVSIFGLILFLEGLFYIMITNAQFKKLHKVLRLEKFYYVGLVYAIVVGIVLLFLSFT